MKKHLAKITLLSLVAAALAASPLTASAQDKSKIAAPETAPPAPSPKKHGLPFKGKVATVDAAAMSFTVGTMTIVVNSQTKITKDTKPATFADITVGETATGAYKKDDAGKLTATTVRVTDKAPPKEKKKTEDAATPPTTPK